MLDHLRCKIDQLLASRWFRLCPNSQAWCCEGRVSKHDVTSGGPRPHVVSKLDQINKHGEVDHCPGTETPSAGASEARSLRLRARPGQTHHGPKRTRLDMRWHENEATPVFTSTARALNVNLKCTVHSVWMSFYSLACSVTTAWVSWVSTLLSGSSLTLEPFWLGELIDWRHKNKIKDQYLV